MLTGRCGLALPQLAFQNGDIFQGLMFSLKPQRFSLIVCVVTHVPELSGAEVSI